MDDARAGLPETHSVLAGGGLQEVVDLAVLVEGVDGVRAALDPRLDQVVAMYGRGHCNPFPSGLHELEHGHLARHVLVCDAVGPEHEVAVSGRQLLALGVVQVAQEYLLGQVEGPSQLPPGHGQVGFNLLVCSLDEFRSGVYNIGGHAAASVHRMGLVVGL